VETFAARAALYEDWDRRVFTRTRFFAAAAVTNAALVELCSRHVLARLLCAAGLDFLARLGGQLQSFNVAIAERIEHGRWHACPDEALVMLEQAVVEKLLGDFASADERAHGSIIRQLDRLLYCLGHARRYGLSSCGPNTGMLSCGVRIARSGPGQCLSFASMRDRVAIGRALVCLLRSSESCYFTQRIHTTSRLLRLKPGTHGTLQCGLR
jgi:hypothetical protein